ncbi:transposase [Streptosporangium sp. NPDC052375]|uniref:transposase n=1 Tax=Streptosporangium sp. NPDC052375 TaxID=3366195 RepID=UPI0037D5CBB5
MVSCVDPEARHMHKNRTQRQDGYKAHLAVEPESGIYTAVALRPGTGADHHEAAVAEQLLNGEDGPVTVLADAAYGTGQARQRPPATR